MLDLARLAGRIEILKVAANCPGAFSYRDLK